MRTYQVIVMSEADHQNVITLPFVSILRHEVQAVTVMPRHKRNVRNAPHNFMDSLRGLLVSYDRHRGLDSHKAARAKFAVLRRGRRRWGDAIQSVDDVRIKLRELNHADQHN